MMFVHNKSPFHYQTRYLSALHFTILVSIPMEAIRTRSQEQKVFANDLSSSCK